MKTQKPVSLPALLPGFVTLLTAALLALGCTAPGADDGAGAGDEPGVLSRLVEPEPEIYRIPAGTVLAAALDETLSSENSQPGESFRAHLTRGLVIDGKTVVPAGSVLLGNVSTVTPVKKFGGQAKLGADLHSLELPSGDRVAIDAGFYRVARSSKRKDTTAIAGGAASGAAAGQLLERDSEGTLVGAIVGAAAGAAIAATNKAQPVVLPAGTQLQLELQQPITVTVKGG